MSPDVERYWLCSQCLLESNVGNSSSEMLSLVESRIKDGSKWKNPICDDLTEIIKKDIILRLGSYIETSDSPEMFELCPDCPYLLEHLVLK